MDKYRITLTGGSPLLMHHDNIEWADTMKVWGKDPANKKDSIAGDDRSPAFRWIGALYVGTPPDTKEVQVVMPSDNLMTMLREGGKQCPTGKKGGSFKARTQSGILIESLCWAFEVNGERIPYAPIKAAMSKKNFEDHEKLVAELGFKLLVKRAQVGTAKHVRVRPMFKDWVVRGELLVVDDMITKDVLVNILTFAGAYSGLCDWRPGAPRSPGQFGRFTPEIEEL